MMPTRWMKSAVIRARCSPELAAQVTALARHWELQPSDIVRLAVQDYVLHYASVRLANTRRGKRRLTR